MASLISRKGQTSLEVLMALAILAIMTSASFVLFGTTIQQESLSRERSQASAFVQQGMEASRQIRERDWNALTTGVHGLVNASGDWVFSGSSDTSGVFQRVVTVAGVDSDNRDVNITVSWTSAVGGAVQESAVSRLSNRRAMVIPSASNCVSSGSISGDWALPVVLGSADIGPGNQGTDIAVKYPYVFMSGVASSSTKPDLFVFDASNPVAPSAIKTVDIGANGINSLSLAGNYLYAASSNDTNELMVFDVSTPGSSTKIGASDLSGSTNGLAVLASAHWVVLGRASNSAGEIYIYDVTTPSTPSLVASFEAGGDVNDFATNGSLLYAVSSSVGNDLTIINMVDPIHPALVKQFDLKDGNPDISVAYHDPNKLFIGDNAGHVAVVDVTTPTSPAVVGSYNTGGAVQDMLCIVDNLIFTGTANGTKEFQVLDITNLASIKEFSSMNFPQVATGIDFANNMVFVSMRSNDALRIITSSP